MVGRYAEETSVSAKEAVLSALSSFIRADNFEGKRRFIQEFDGTNFLAGLICADAKSPEKQSLRLQKKVVIFLNDLVLNDDNIVEEDPCFVRRSLS